MATVRPAAARRLALAVLACAGASACEKSHDEWAAQLASGDRFDRWLAAVALSRDARELPDPAADALVRALMDASPSVRACSRRALGRHPLQALASLGEEIDAQSRAPLNDASPLLAAFLGELERDHDPSRRMLAAVEDWRSSAFVRELGARAGDGERVATLLATMLGSPSELAGFVAAWGMIAVRPDGALFERSIASLEAEAERGGDAQAPERARGVAARAMAQRAIESGFALDPDARRWISDPRSAPGLLASLHLHPNLYPRATLHCLVHLAGVPPSAELAAQRARDPELVELRRRITSGRVGERLQGLLDAARLGRHAAPLSRLVARARADRHGAVRWLAGLAWRRIRSDARTGGAPFG